MDELVAAKGDTHVGGATTDRLKEDEVAGSYLIAINTRSRPILVLNLARERMSVAREHVLHESAAVEP